MIGGFFPIAIEQVFGNQFDGCAFALSVVAQSFNTKVNDAIGGNGDIFF